MISPPLDLTTAVLPNLPLPAALLPSSRALCGDFDLPLNLNPSAHP